MSNIHEAYNRLDQHLRMRMQVYHNPGLALALTTQERTVRLSALGYSNLDSKTPLHSDHLFSIGSIGKAFTGVAVLQASDAGLIDLHAPVKTYLPWFEVKSPYEPITIHHLLTHTSGLPRGTDCTPDPRSEVYALRELEVGFPPGRHFFYSDLGYKVLGLVLQAVTGKPYPVLLHENIFKPLEMQDTFAMMTHHIRPRMAVGYRSLFDDRPSHPSYPRVQATWIETDSADGSIISTAGDMAKFARMLLNKGCVPDGRILSEAAYERMITPQIEDEGEAYSYGLHLFEDEGYHHAGHGGDIPGYESYMWLDLDNLLGAVVLMTQPYTPRASFLALEFFRAITLGQLLPDPILPDFTHIANPEEYAGVYDSSEGPLILQAEGHHLLLMAGNERVVLEERSIDCFYANHPDWNLFLLRFERNAAGAITQVCYGPRWFTNERYDGPRSFETPPEWEAYAGHYRSHNPWETNFRVFSRKGQLILCWPAGDEEYLIPLGGGVFRIGEEEYIPERLCFDQIVEGKALRAVRSGCPYYRFFTP